MPISRVALEDDGNVSNAVVEAVAQEKGISPTDLQTPLHRVVDADARPVPTEVDRRRRRSAGDVHVFGL